jgi:hypothetical protein
LRSTGRIAESNRHRSRERVISLPLRPKAEVVMKSSLSQPIVTVMACPACRHVFTIASYLAGCTTLRACTKEYYTSGMYQGQLQEYTRSTSTGIFNYTRILPAGMYSRSIYNPRIYLPGYHLRVPGRIYITGSSYTDRGARARNLRRAGRRHERCGFQRQRHTTGSIYLR